VTTANEEKQMHIATSQRIAGYPVLRVREFVRRHRFSGILAEAAEEVLALSPEAADNFLSKLMDLGLIAEWHKRDGNQLFQLTSTGQALANASAAKPIHRKTAERILSQLQERVHIVNAASQYPYRVNDVVLFGSMLSDVDRLGDLDVAVNLEPKVRESAAFGAWSMARRHAAQAEGRSFSSCFEWAYWPMKEIHNAHSRSLSLHELAEIKYLHNPTYRVLLGDPEQLAASIPNGRAV
jgi:predicted nucleotidyltransferase